MKNTTISISIPSNVYAGLKVMADKDMRSARNYIAKLIIEHVPDNLLPKEKIETPQKPKEIAAIKAKNTDECYCKKCGVHVHLKPEQFKNSGELCLNCNKLKFHDDD